MKVKITNRVGVRGKTALPGDVVDVSRDEARILVNYGDGEYYAEPAAPAPEKPKKKRGRPRKKVAQKADDKD